MVRRGDGQRGGAGAPQDAAAARAMPATVERVGSFREELLDLRVQDLDDQGRLELLHALEVLTRAIGAVSVETQVAFHTSQVAQQLHRGVAPSRAGKGVPDDLALARMTSPYWGSRELTSAKALLTQMPQTFAALRDGVISAYQARLITEATVCLSPEDRAEVDSRLVSMLEGASTAEIVSAVRGLVYEVDPAGFVNRARKAAEDRGVSVRPCPDVMALLSARLPGPAAIACYKLLRDKATAMRASGDPRTLGQLMADELFERLTGRSVVDGIDVEVGLVITDTALFAGTSEAAVLEGLGPVPAELARELLRPAGSEQDQAGAGDDQRVGDRAGDESDDDTPDPCGELCPAGGRCTDAACPLLHGDPDARGAHGVHRPDDEPFPGAHPSSPALGSGAPTGSGAGAGLRSAKVWLRRLYVDPVSGTLVRRDPRKRLFTGSLRALLVARDRTCRNAWCGAPVRHVDHITPHARSGSTDEDNGRGLCAHCNLAREHPQHLPRPPETYRPPPPLLPTFLTVVVPQGP